MYQSRLKYRTWQPRATLTLPSTVLQRLVYSAVFTARLVGYLNCDLGGGGGGRVRLPNSRGGGGGGGGGGGCSSPWQIPVECAASILPRTRTLPYISDQK